MQQTSWQYKMTIVVLMLMGLPQVTSAAVHCVTTLGSGCDMSVCADCFLKIQDGINAAASGDEVRVSAGTYSDLTTALIDMGGTNYTFKQVALIKDKNLTLRGGYAAGDWSQSNPSANPTIIDAKGYLAGGRGISVLGSGTHKVTIDGFTVQNGNYTGLGSPDSSSPLACMTAGGDCGGGLYVNNAQIRLRNSIIRNNIGSTTKNCFGGGIFLGNTTVGSELDHVTIAGNQCSTSAQGNGGGMGVYNSWGLLSINNSIIQYNTSSSEGGGVSLATPQKMVMVTDTLFYANSSRKGGGLIADLVMPSSIGTALIMDRVRFDGNTATDDGAALNLRTVNYVASSQVELNNLLFTRNQTLAPGPTGSVVTIHGVNDFNVLLRQVTAAGNTAGSFLYATPSFNLGPVVHVELQNTLVDTIPVAVYGATDGNAGVLHVDLANTLVHNVTTLKQGHNGSSIIMTDTNTITADPRLSTSYQLQNGSPAIDKGMVTNVTTDIDGDPRPAGGGYDIGADEYRFPWTVFIPVFLLNRGQIPTN